MRKLLADKIKDLPKKPGIYMFKDAQGLFLYVGKAVNIKNRVSSYFRKDAGEESARIQLMISKIADLDYVVTDNEVESLVLENNFIKQIKPKYNVRLRDDKNYLFIKINTKDEIPTIHYERKTEDRQSRYFGPYTSSQSIKDTLRLVRKVFPYCANSTASKKPCFYYQIDKCPGVCFGKISLEEYRENYIKKIIKFLEGKQTEILKELQSYMKFLARHRQYEKAARVRDQIFALNRVLERQKLVYAKKVDQDVFSMHCESVASINLFIIRDGKLIQKENFIVENTKQVSEQEILESFLTRYYLDAVNLPKEILLPVKIDDTELQTLFKQQGHNIRLSTPSRGPKTKLIELGKENAKQYLEAQSDKHLLDEARLLAALKELQRVLELPTLPARLECFDISNIQGSHPVGSMVVFDFGHPKKDEYRKFKINRKNTPDDFAMMSEMLERRFKRSAETDPTKKWPDPDMIIIDGGKGQLSAALSAVRQITNSNITIPIIGLAKRIEEIFLTGKSAPIILPHNSIALFLLQRIRDEAHRFAITYHRKLRSRSAVASILDQIAGIGPAKKKLLLQKFGSAAKIRTASLTEIATIIGSKAAEKIKASL